MNHKAIYALYDNVVTIDDTEGAFDKDGNSVTIHMDNVNCSGNEKDLRDCSSLQGPTRHNCNHYEDVVLECNN